LKKNEAQYIRADNYVLVIASRLVFTNVGKKEDLIIEGIGYVITENLMRIIEVRRNAQFTAK